MRRWHGSHRLMACTCREMEGETHGKGSLPTLNPNSQRQQKENHKGIKDEGTNQPQKGTSEQAREILIRTVSISAKEKIKPICQILIHRNNEYRQEIQDGTLVLYTSQIFHNNYFGSKVRGWEVKETSTIHQWPHQPHPHSRLQPDPHKLWGWGVRACHWGRCQSSCIQHSSAISHLDPPRAFSHKTNKKHSFWWQSVLGGSLNKHVHIYGFGNSSWSPKGYSVNNAILGDEGCMEGGVGRILRRVYRAVKICKEKNCWNLG